MWRRARRENYLCCQGYLPACLCFPAAHCGEREGNFRGPACASRLAPLSRLGRVVDALPADGHVPPRGGRVRQPHHSPSTTSCKFCPVFATALRCSTATSGTSRAAARSHRGDRLFRASAGCMTAQVDAEIKYQEAAPRRREITVAITPSRRRRSRRPTPARRSWRETPDR